MERPGPGRPDWAGLSGMVEDLREAMSNIDAAKRKMLRITGRAWSADGMVTAVVGPRGHLMDLEIDPRIYRKPNSAALAALIVATVREATEQVLVKAQNIVDESVPGDLRVAKVGALDVRELALTHDADLAIEEDDDGDVR